MPEQSRHGACSTGRGETPVYPLFVLGVHGYSTMCVHFFRQPIIDSPPEWVLPDPDVDQAFYGEVWLRYPLNNTHFPLYFGHIFKARSEYCVILNDTCRLVFPPAAERKYAPKDIADLYGRYTKWHADLPSCLSPQRISHTAHLKLQCVPPCPLTVQNLSDDFAACCTISSSFMF